MDFAIEDESGVELEGSVFETGALLLQAVKIAKAIKARSFFMMANLFYVKKKMTCDGIRGGTGQ